MLLHRIPQVVEEDDDEKEEEEAETGDSRKNATRRHQRVPRVPAEENGEKRQDVRVSGAGGGGGGGGGGGSGFFSAMVGRLFSWVALVSKKNCHKSFGGFIILHIFNIISTIVSDTLTFGKCSTVCIFSTFPDNIFVRSFSICSEKQSW
jgi:hypothetical protein